MKFIDMDVQSKLSSGSSAPEELAKFAEELGFSAIVVADVWAGPEKFAAAKEAVAEAAKNVGIEVVQGVKIVAANPNELRHVIDKVREKTAVVAVAGGNYQINRAACECSKVDLLCHPSLGRTDNGLDEVCLNAARENNVAIELNFREVLHSYRRQRSIILANMAANIKLCEALRVPMVIASGAQSVEDLRDPRELISIADILGLELSKAFATVSDIPGRMIDINRRKLTEKITAEGVEVMGGKNG
ncbi:MAG: RNase P subunit p30 family protein [Candidatus Aenigmatarchaeota archaeon]